MPTEPKWTAGKIKALKGRAKFACLTAYDYTTARLLDEAGLPLLLVGDSLAMTMLGYADTLPVTMEAMLHHTAAVARGVKTAMVVADMPFMSYQASISQAIANAGRFVKQAGADADGRCRNGLGNFLAEDRRHTFENHGKDPGFSQRLGIVQESLSFDRFFALDLVAAHGMNALRRQADVAQHRDAVFNERFYRGRAEGAAFDFHGVGAGFLDETAGICNGL